MEDKDAYMENGREDYDLVEACELEYNKIPAIFRMTELKKKFAFIFSLTLVLCTLAVITTLPKTWCAVPVETYVYNKQTDSLDSVVAMYFPAGKVIIVCCVVILLTLVVAWYALSRKLESEAYSRACAMARDHNYWVKEKFVEEYNKTLVNSNYKN